MTTYHYSPNSLLNPYDPIDVILVGCGGTGCQILTGLAKINHAVKALGHRTGLRVITVDPDTVSPSNIGRQTFSTVDINSNKARVLTERVNRWYGTDWLHIPELFNDTILSDFKDTTFVISAIDNVQGRRDIVDTIQKNKKCSYWMDFGNSSTSGQVILSTNKSIEQPEEGCKVLPNIFDFFPKMEDHEDVNEPSCSLPEALESQDLFINQMLATYGLDVIWKMFKFGKIDTHGVFIDIQNYVTSPVSVKSSYDRFVAS